MKHRIFDDGDIVARSESEVKRRIQDKLQHKYPGYVVEHINVWLKDGPQLRTERSRWYEYTCTLAPKSKKRRKHED